MELFLKENSKLKNVLLGSIKNWETKYGIQVRYAQCDNAGENVYYEQTCKQEGTCVKFECTPQQNSHVAWKGMYHAQWRKFFFLLEKRLWAEAAAQPPFWKKISLHTSEI